MSASAAPAVQAAAPLTHLLYLHGFRSSPRSFKAQRMQAWMQQHQPDVHWWCPQLPPSPREAVELLERGTADWPREGMAVVGSSLGGFYATVMAERLGCRAALINPAVEPARDLAKYIGEQTAFHDPQQHFFFRPEFVDELRALHPPAVTRPQRYLALVATGDEVLDWREMAARYAQCQLHVIQGSDHALSDFDAHLPQLLAFLGLSGNTRG
ncbi:YqiA/YcfP family alpha/beta fold hydrolase [Azohydromonas australica]|uniref:YqiA/YcfP family alpha/beta fold hydrolase n=1 Tax=Azohydromonas australica TaxID=364039 RepID=UPI0004178B47|nr:YqiA/YcfP family alpha/beta fold hydrolase [Azohydromonas australica]